jgi:hypothetical protein
MWDLAAMLAGRGDCLADLRAGGELGAGLKPEQAAMRVSYRAYPDRPLQEPAGTTDRRPEIRS